MKRLIASITLLLSVTAFAVAQNPFHRGEGEFVYTGYAPLADKPITVFYYIPSKGDITSMRVLFSMHGAERSGVTQRSIWKDFAEADGFIVIAPEYTGELYNENAYQFGNVFTNNRFEELNPKELWAYNIIEALFDYFKEQTGSRAAVYDMWGHSAGGQFTHRFLWAMPDARINIAVASNPGSWTFPYAEGLPAPSGKVYGWPYSIMRLPYDSDELLRKTFAKKLYVHLGTLDTATMGRYEPKDEASLTEGRFRYERGKNFFDASKSLAKKMGTKFNWKKVEIEGVGHAGRRMVYGKGKPGPNGLIFDIDYITRTGAYYLIYH